MLYELSRALAALLIVLVCASTCTDLVTFERDPQKYINPKR